MIWDVPARLREHPLLYDWSADGQKLYGWLRRRVCRGEADCPREAREYHAQGFLTAYATADLLMAQALPVSRNTITKLIADMRQRRVLATRNVGHGHVFLLGEWEERPSRLADDQPLYWEVFYLDGLLALSVGHGPDQRRQPGSTEGGAARR